MKQIWSVRGRYGRRCFLQAEVLSDGNIHYTEYDVDGFSTGGGYVSQSSFAEHIAYAKQDYPSLRLATQHVEGTSS